uniref:Huntingtin n=1 Tax=Panagrolaimus superbus TaxID=310955 RepID=A0A914YS56_9BILA
MFRKRKHDKLQKAVETIKTLLQESPKKGASIQQVKHESLFNDIYDALTSSEAIAKEELLAAVDILFIASGSSKSSLQIQADQTLNKAFRVLWLKGQVQKVITLILNELNQSQERTWKTVAVAYKKLVYYVQFSRASKNESYALYYINSVAVAIKRPEDGIHTTISKTFAPTMKHLGPFISDKVEDKVFELFENAVKNLELSGTSGRVASLVIAELSLYSKKVLEKCVKVINRMMVLQILKMLLSPSNELIVAALEALEVLFAIPSSILNFIPNELPTLSGPGSEYGSPTPMRTPRRLSKGTIADQISQWELLGSPWGSVNDISMEEPSYQAQGDIADSADAQSLTGSLNDTRSETAETSQMFSDPLINATQASDTISLLDANIEEPENSIEMFWYDAQSLTFPIFSAAIISRRFLLTNKRPGYDDNSRISHKFMAFKSLVSIFDSNPFVSTNIIEIAGNTKIWHEVFEFISHSDDKLATAAFEFYIVFQNALHLRGQNTKFSRLSGYLHIMLNGVNPMKIKGTLDALKNTINYLILDDHVCSLILEYCNNLHWCTYFLVQCSRVELLAKILWKKISPAIVMQYQNKCLQSIIQLFNHEDHRVQQAAASAFSDFVKNAVFGNRSLFSSQNIQILDYHNLINIEEKHKIEKLPNRQLQQNICHALEILSDQCLKIDNQSSDSLITYVHGIEALIKDHNLTILLDVWFSNSSLTSFQNSLILNLIEISSSNITVDNLVTILNVLSYLLETKEFVETKPSEHSNVVPKTKVKLEMRVILVFLRVINLYYTVYVENKAKQNAPSSTALFIPESPSKQDESRTNDISYLVGTGVHQMKGANYNDSPTLKSLESTIQGSYKNFMETLDIEIQNRFLSPLIACLNGLERILPKFAFQDANIFLDELLLYINRLMPFVVSSATGVLSELLKVLFGRNLSVATLPQKPHQMSHSLSFSHKDLICKSFEDFAYFLTKLSSPGYVEEGVLNHFSIIYCRTQAKQGRVSFETVTDVLRRFEKASAYLVSHAFLSNDNQTRCKIIDFLCILLLEGVEYRMADPKRKVYDFVIAAMTSPTPDVLPILSHLLNFLVVLSMVDPTFVKPQELEKAAVTVCGKISDENIEYGFPCIGLVLLYNVSLNAKSITLIQKLLSTNFQKWLFTNPVKTLQLWTLLLCCSKKDKDKALYDEISNFFVEGYFNFHKHPANLNCKWSVEATLWATNAFFACSSHTFTPIDQFYHFLKDITEIKSQTAFIGCIPVLALISQLDEQRMLLRLECLVDDPVSSLCRSLGQCWIYLVNTFCQSKSNSAANVQSLQGHIILMSKLLLYYMKAQNQIGIKLKDYLLNSIEFNILIEHKEAFTNALPYIIFVLAEAGYSEISSVVSIGAKMGYDMKNIIYNLVADILKTTSHQNIFTEEQCIKVIENTKFSEWLLRNPSLSSKIFKNAPTVCSQHLIMTQFSYLSNYPMDFLFPMFRNNLILCLELNIELPESLKSLQEKILPYSSHEQCVILRNILSKQNLHPLLPVKEGTLVSYFSQIVRNAKSFDEIKELAQPSLLMSSEDFVTLLSYMPHNYHEMFLKECLKHLENLACEAIGVQYISSNHDHIKNVQNILDHLFSAIQNQNLFNATFDLHIIFDGIYKIAKSPFVLNINKFTKIEDFFVNNFVEPLIEYSVSNKQLPEIYFTAMTSFFSMENVLETFTPDYDCLELLSPFLALLVKNIEKILGKQEPAINKDWNVQISTVSKSEMYKEDIIDLFNSIQKISLFIQLPDFIILPSSAAIESSLKALCRLPLLSSMFVIPEVALRQSWSLKIDARSDRIFVPLVNIYILEDPTVLKDFSFRTLWLGWINRCQFENYCTSLFGVLSTTPVGNELQAAVSEENLYRSINSVSIAVETISNLLIQSLLYPFPGNPVSSIYPTKHRESLDHRPFLESKLVSFFTDFFIKFFQGVEDKHLLQNVSCFKKFLPSIAFKENFEKTTDATVYGIGQSSLLYLWSIAGVLEHGDGGEASEKLAMTPSVSDYMLKQSTDLDTASTLRALLDNFDHWFAKKKMPMTLKIAVLKSLLILTDLFDDVKNYQKIYYEMYDHLNTITTADTVFDGLAIFLLLKCAAVLGTDSIGNDDVPNINKFIDSVVVKGIQSNNIVVRQYTLQGMLYLLQSYLLDDLPASLAVMKELVLEELLKLSLTSDVVTTGDFIPLHYEQVLWSSSFRLLEEAVSLDDNNKANFLTLVCKLYSDPRLSSFQKRLLTSGIESLIIHSSTYNEQLLPTILDLFNQENGKAEKSKIVDFNRLINLIAAFSTQPIAYELANIISYILTTTTQIPSLIENITMLITVPGHKPNSSPPLLQPFDLAALQIFSRSLIACTQKSPLTFVDLLLKQISPRLAMILDDDYAAFLISLILISGVQKDNAALWVSAILSAYSYRRPLKPIIAQLPLILHQFVTMMSERKSITTIESALELFSLKTEDGQNFIKIPERVKHFN